MKIKLASLLLVALAAPISAQTNSKPVEKITFAQVSLSETCSVYSQSQILLAGEGQIETAGILAPIIGGVLGDIAGAGLNAIGSALEEASRERAIGAEGATNFEFYSLSSKNSSIAAPRVGDDLRCLTISVPSINHVNDDDGRPDWAPPADDATIDGRTVASKDGGPLTEDQISLYRSQIEAASAAQLDGTTELYIEIEITQLQDGFILKPVHIRYNNRLPGAPKSKALPAELHISFSVPTSVNEGKSTQEFFAIGRIKLPKLAPGDIWWARQLNGQSNLLPFRPTTGSTSTLKTVLSGVSVRDSAAIEVEALKVQLAHSIGLRLKDGKASSCVAIVCPTYLEQSRASWNGKELAEVVSWAKSKDSKLPKEVLEALGKAETAYAANMLSYEQSEIRLAKLIGNKTLLAGSTTVNARFVLMKNANKFGLAVAGALKKQEQPLATAISGAITRDDPEWTQALSDYAIAKLEVDHKENELARAQEGGDEEKIEQAELALLTAKAKANLRAAAIGQVIPYPAIGN